MINDVAHLYVVISHLHIFFRETSIQILCQFLYWVIFLFIVCFVCLFAFWPHGLWDLSSPTRDGTQARAVKVWSPNHWTTTSESPVFLLLSCKSSLYFLDTNPSSATWFAKLFSHSPMGFFFHVLDICFICFKDILLGNTTWEFFISAGCSCNHKVGILVFPHKYFLSSIIVCLIFVEIHQLSFG